jgi:hypothetical protein
MLSSHLKSCPHCGQPLPITRLGVRLTPLKARLFDVIARSGLAGMATEDVKAIMGMSTTCLLIEDEGFRIRASRGRGAVIRLVPGMR